MQTQSYKIVILGSSGVGKSSLVCRYINKRFASLYSRTVEDYYRFKIISGADTIFLEIFDTAGSEEFKSLRNAYFKFGQGFILVFSINSVESFYYIRNIYQDIMTERRNENIPIILVGNKQDLTENVEVPQTNALRLAKELNIPIYFSSSAKTGHNINQIFITMVELLNQKPLKNHKKCNCCSLM